LLVSCSPEAADAVLGAFHEAGFAEAAVVGRMQALPADARAGVRFA
jgi:selenide,water dikinase